MDIHPDPVRASSSTILILLGLQSGPELGVTHNKLGFDLKKRFKKRPGRSIKPCLMTRRKVSLPLIPGHPSSASVVGSCLVLSVFFSHRIASYIHIANK